MPQAFLRITSLSLSSPQAPLGFLGQLPWRGLVPAVSQEEGFQIRDCKSSPDQKALFGFAWRQCGLVARALNWDLGDLVLFPALPLVHWVSESLPLPMPQFSHL